MKTIMKNLLIAVAALVAFSCDNQFDLDYKAPVAIEFAGIDQSNMVTVDKGVTTYTATINVKGTGVGLSLLQIYEANNQTGEQGSLLDEQTISMDNNTYNYSYTYTFSGLNDNQCIKVIVTDAEGNTYQRNLLVKITPSVIFTETITMETAEVYYGIYFASWLNGRAYMRENGAAYANEIDLSLGEADLGTGVVPAIISPAKRGDYGLLNISGVTDTKVAETTLSADDFNNISKVDASPIEAVADPTLDAVELANGKVYVFKTAAGKKGLFYVSSLSNQTGTVETPDEWVPNSIYRRVTVAAKVIAQ